jgi:hypothetical protein
MAKNYGTDGRTNGQTGLMNSKEHIFQKYALTKMSNGVIYKIK